MQLDETIRAYVKIIKNIFNRNSAFKGKEKTNLWASQIAVSQKHAIKELFSLDFQPFSEKYPQEFKKASVLENSHPYACMHCGYVQYIEVANERCKRCQHSKGWAKALNTKFVN